MNTDYTFENWYEEFHNLFTEIDLSDRRGIAKAAFDRAKDGKLVKPWKLTREIPGFRPLRDGEEWQRTDWTEEMLPEGWRPLLKGESAEDGDEFYYDGGPGWRRSIGWSFDAIRDPYRTRRPLPEPQPEPAKVPLGPEDVPPGSAIRPSIEETQYYLVLAALADGVTYAHRTEVRFRTYQQLMDGPDSIHCPGNLDANGKPIFVPCSKEGGAA